MNVFLSIGKILFGFIEPLIAPLMAYLKGRSDAKKDERLKSNEEYIRRVNDSADPDIVPIDKDSSNRDNG